jgi:hypothetical protein
MSYNDFSRSSAPRRRLAQQIANATSLRLYQSPAGRATRIDCIHVTNHHGSSSDVTIHHVAPGETAGTGNAILYQVTVAKNAVLVDDAPKYLLPGDELIVSCTTGAHVTVTVYGEEG